MSLHRELFDPFPNASELGIDIETTGLSFFRDQVTAIALSDGETAHVFDVRDIPREEVSAWLREYVYPKPLVVHNAAFDLVFLRHHYGLDYPAVVHDTKLCERLLLAGRDDDEHVSLKDVAFRMLGIELSKEHEIRTGFQLGVEWSVEQVAYAERDAMVLVPIARRQRQWIRAEQLERAWEIECAALPVFCEMIYRGILVDTDRLAPLIGEAERKMQALRERLEVLLTEHVAWLRIEQNRAEEAKLALWNERYEEAKRYFEDEWDRIALDWSARDEAKRRYVGTTLDDGKTITEKEVESWFDTALDKKDGQPKGKKRYVKRMLYLWRREPGNERPQLSLKPVDEVINLNSPAQLQAALQSLVRGYNQRNGTRVPVPPDLKKNTLRALLVDYPDDLRRDVLEPLLEYKKHAKLVQAFGETLLAQLDEQGYLHGEWQQYGTQTGRPSCTNPNLLNLPSDHRFRACFRARPGNLFVIIDYSQIELRLIAQLSRDPQLVRAFVEGKDLHALTAAGIYNVPVEQVTESQRKVGKTVNFGIMYGLGPRGLMTQLLAAGQKVTQSEARSALDGWRQTYPVAAETLARWRNQAVSLGYTTTAFGRRRRFQKPAKFDEGEIAAIQRAGANHPIQGSSADITKLAMASIQQLVAPLGGFVVLQVYDEIVVEVPEEQAVEAAILAARAATSAAELVLTDVPVAVDCYISPSWDEQEGVALNELVSGVVV